MYGLETPSRLWETVPVLTLESWLGVGLGAFLIFYAFLGFEDMVTLAQEVKNPQRTLPLGIIFTLGLTATIYLSVSGGCTGVAAGYFDCEQYATGAVNPAQGRSRRYYIDGD